MNFEEFKQQIMEDLPGALPERLSNVEIEPVSVTKLQHGNYDGITIREEGSNIECLRTSLIRRWKTYQWNIALWWDRMKAAHRQFS